MYEFIEGKIDKVNPTSLILEVNGIGYFIHITLNTYSILHQQETCRIFIHEVIREDAFLLYGFSDLNERSMFRHLISVSGIGANTASVMLSSISPQEIKQAILSADVNVLKSIKGIGLKTAQRAILELKDKIGKSNTDGSEILLNTSNTIREESLSALVMLGFNKAAAEKIIDQLYKQNPSISIEDLVKNALKQL